MIIGMSGKHLTIKNIQGPTGVRGRNSDNGLIREMLGWSPTQSLESGIEKTYAWIERVRNES
jgi:nucleoside-diphosphate-sugar epimerase